MEEKDSSAKPNKFIQRIVVVIASIGGFLVGLSIGWSSPAADILESRKQLTTAGISWISGSLAVGAAFSVFPITYLADTYGRKTVMFWCAPLLMLGWLVLALGKSPPIFILGRIITGFFSMSYSVTSMLYVRETVEKNYQLLWNKIAPVLTATGILVSYSLGLLNEIFIMSLFPSSISLLFAILIYIIPETPVFLLKSGEVKKAKKSLQWLRGKRCDISEELTSMQSLANEVIIGENTTLFSAFDLKATSKAMWISIGLIFCQQMSGVNIITYYSVLIFKATENVLSASLSSAIFAAVEVAAMLVAVFLIGKFKNVAMLIISLYVMGFSLFALGTYIKISQHNRNEMFNWFVLFWCCVYIIAYNIGCALIVPSIIENLFPDGIKRDAIMLSNCVNYLLIAIITQTFYYMQKIIGLNWTIWIYAVFCFLATAFIFIFVFRKESIIREQFEIELKNKKTEDFFEEEETYM